MKRKIEKIIADISIILEQDYKNRVDNSLLGGTSGILLFYFYLYKVTKKNKWRKICIELIERHITDIHTGYLRGYTLSEGAIGVCWVLIHINKYDNSIFEGSDIEVVLSELDEYIIDCAISDYQKNHYDLLHGPLGAIFYFLERKTQSKKVQDFLLDSVDFFKNYQHSCGGWPVLNKNLGKPFSSETVFDLGLSHGNPSIVMILGQLYQKNYFTTEIREMIYGNLQWLSLCKMTDNVCLYPTAIQDTYSRNGILGWCYGDLGISLSLLSLATVFDDNSIHTEALEVVERCIERRNEVVNNLCHSICHGTAGVAFILQQIDKNYGIDTKIATNTALKAAINKAYSFKSNYPYQNIVYEEGKQVWEDNVSFLEGLAGIGLVLLSFISDVEPNWRKCLLI